MTASQPTASISGHVDRITFRNERNGYTVFELSRDQFSPLTVVAFSSSIHAGQWIEANGSYFNDMSRGSQFRADDITCHPPKTPAALVKYLASGLFEGIGAAQAKKLIEKFGTSFLSMLDEAPEQLDVVPGLGPKRRQALIQAWETQKSHSRNAAFFNGLGLKQDLVIRIQQIHGANAIQAFQSDPFSALQEVADLDFSTTDAVASQLGILPNSELRIRSGLISILKTATRSGHCAVEESRLLKHAADFLQIDVSSVHPVLSTTVNESRLFREKTAAGNLIYLPLLFNAENRVAFRLRKLAGLSSALPPIHWEKAVQWYESENRGSLSESQKNALQKLFANRLLIVTGGPGVGKTSLVRAAFKILEAKRSRILLAAPTGRAAKRLSEVTGAPAKTIHRLLEYDPAKHGFTRDSAHPLECDLLVVDEASMVDLLLMDSLLEALPEHAHLVMVGDTDQLPPIGPGNVLADLIASEIVPSATLTDIFRQSAGSDITPNAYRIHAGQPPTNNGKDSDFFFIVRNNASEIQATLLHLISHRIPSKFPAIRPQDIQVLSPTNLGSLGTQALNGLLQEAVNPHRTGEIEYDFRGSHFRPRDKVIQRENDYNKNVFNGDIGEILAIDLNKALMVIEFDGREVTYDLKGLNQISLAYCITVHKAQGSEYPVAVVIAASEHGRLLQRNLLYTAVTRGKQFLILLGDETAVTTAVNNSAIPERTSCLRARLRADLV